MTPNVHFVGFSDDHGRTFRSAVKVFGLPTFMHQRWDQRAQREITQEDVILFAKGDEDPADMQT